MIPKHIEREGGNPQGGITTTYIWEDGLTFSFDRDQDYGVDPDKAYAYIFHDWHEWQLDSDGSFTFRRFGRKDEDSGEHLPVPGPWSAHPVWRFLKILEAEYLATLNHLLPRKVYTLVICADHWDKPFVFNAVRFGYFKRQTIEFVKVHWIDDEIILDLKACGDWHDDIDRGFGILRDATDIEALNRGLEVLWNCAACGVPTISCHEYK